ncbi:MAG: amidophosphoribosyltransferase [archaeon]|nr:amidophosphoribosyltransferase [archaeon]
MGGIFGVVSKEDCTEDLFYGTDYHSHLGTVNGGMVVKKDPNNTYVRSIHDISNSQFRSKMDSELVKMRGANMGLGVISDHDSQPLIVNSNLGVFSLVTVNKIANLEELVTMFHSRREHLLERSGNEPNSTEIIAALISKGSNYSKGLEIAQDMIQGSCSTLLLTNEGIYAARDKLGRTPLILGKKEGSYAVTFETSAFENLGFERERDLGPGEIVLITPEGIEQKKKPGNKMQICSFLGVYYGYPTSTYEGINVDRVRKKCGIALAEEDQEDLELEKYKIDIVAGIPDSGNSHARGYSNHIKIPLESPLVKYTPTWPRSFMPQNPEMRKLIAKMKLIPNQEFIRDKNLLFCDDSIVRGTQLEKLIQKLRTYGVKQVHMRPACPPLIYGCDFLNFSRSRSVLDLAGRRAIGELEGLEKPSEDTLREYANPCSEKQCAMVEKIRERLGLTTLKYQKLDNLVSAIGLPKEKICTHCFDGSSYF